MVEEIVRKAEQTGANIRLLDDRKMNLSWSGVKGFARELASDGLVPALVMGAVGAGIAALGVGAMFVLGQPIAAGAATVVAYTAGASALAAAGFIGARGAIEEINIARKTNTEIDHAIGLLEKEGFSRSKDANAKANKPFVNVTGGVSLDSTETDAPSTKVSSFTREGIITGIADGLEKFSESAMDIRR